MSRLYGKLTNNKGAERTQPADLWQRVTLLWGSKQRPKIVLDAVVEWDKGDDSPILVLHIPRLSEIIEDQTGAERVITLRLPSL